MSRPEETLLQVLIEHGRERPEQLAYTEVLDGETETERLTYGALDARARAIGAWLQSCNMRGERLLFLFPPGLELLEAFFGGLYAGAICIPAPAPEPERLKRLLPRLRAIVADARPALALTCASLLPTIEALQQRTPELAGVPVIVPREVPDGLADEWSPFSPTGDDVAYLQYTSGSTSTPKGVMIRNGNLMHNLRTIYQVCRWFDGARAANWMPFFHDFGLVEGLLEPLYAGAPTWVMSPLTLLKHPLRWFELISRQRITHSSAPSFVFEHCVSRIGPEQRRHLDLSSWRTYIVGAEPIRLQAIEEFVAAFGPCGFARETITPGYGMAETTLVTTLKPGGRPPAFCIAEAAALDQRGEVVDAVAGQGGVRRVVGCGEPVPGMRVEIVDPATFRALPEDRVGEVWISGFSVGGGYWQREAETLATFGAKLAGGEGPFLRSGDLGFLRDGELYITGRIKDLVIIRGQNHYPQDIEWTVEQCHPGLRASGAAFAMDVEGTERLVVVHEVAPEVLGAANAEIFAAIRQAVLEHHDIAPWAIALVRKILKTSSGKIQRSACRQAFLSGELEALAEWREAAPLVARAAEENRATTPAGPAAAVIQAWLTERLGSRVGLALVEVDVDRPFAQYGLDSMRAVQLVGELEEWLGRTLSPTLFYEHSTIAALTRFLSGEAGEATSAAATVARAVADPREPIAVIGLACRLPGADDPEAFWCLLRDGVDAVSEVPADRWDIDALYDPDPDRPGTMCTRRGGFLRAADRFDAAFFGIAPREAMTMDPQQRLALEVSWEALERAGIAPGSLMGSATGVFLGIATSDYAQLQTRELGLADLDGHRGTGTALCIAANRVSYCLGLEGPSMAVDTACSSSLTAVHLACQSLRAGECALALAGGVNLMLTPDYTIVFSKARMLAPDGRCKTFDAAADGYVRGEGCGVVVLKRLSAALADGDSILAVIRGSAVNQDGLSNGLTAPNGRAQQAVIASAVAAAAVDPLAVGYVEAHGTGTALGDPIEMQALVAVLCAGRLAERPLVVGSVKTNVGHLEAAAGITGLLKVVLALEHREIPPHLHFQQPSPYIPWDRLPVAVPTAARPWEPAQGRRLAGISSFGFGGTNVHLIVEEAPPAPAGAVGRAGELRRPRHLLALSAKNGEALRDLAGRWRDHLSGEVDLADACFSAARGRSPFAHRLAVTAASTGEAKERLAAFLAGDEEAAAAGRSAAAGVRPVFLFTGQGAQRPGMARQLFDTQPAFRRALLECEELLRPHLSRPLTEVLYGGAEEVMQTEHAQPALFAVEYALARLWESWGIRPVAVLGHSVGEYVAACVAGVLEPAEALRLIAARGRLMQATEPGAMAAVEAEEKRVAAVLDKQGGAVAIAAINGPDRVVVSGAESAVAAALAELAAAGVRTRLLEVSRAFHSPLIEPVLDAFAAEAAAIPARAPRLDLVSNLTGEVWPEGQAIDAAYWRQHARQPVRFAAGVEALARQGHRTFLELGPAPTLLGLAGRIVPEALLLPSLRPGREDWEPLLDSLARLWVAGAEVDWVGFDREHGRRRVAVPTYPFQRQRYWIEVPAPRAAAAPPTQSFLGRRLRSPRLGDEVLFEADFAVPALPFLTDHRVYDRVVVSGACHLARVLAGAVAAFGPGPHLLEEVELPQALVLAEDETVQVQLSIRSEEAGRAAFEVWSAAPGEEGWTRHAAGHLRLGGEAPAAWRGAPDLAALRERCCEEIAGDVLNATIRDQRKIALGPTFTWIEHVWRRDGEALGRLRPPRPEERPEAAPLHPGLADGFFQIFVAAVPREALTVGFAYVPAGVERYFFDPRGGTPAWCHARGGIGDNGDAGTVTGEVRVWDEQGALILAAEGIYLRRARAMTLLGARQRPEGWLVEPRWAAAAPAPRQASAPGERTWLLLADRSGVAEALADLLRAQGDRCRLAFAGPAFAELPGGDFSLDPETPEGFGRCLATVRAEAAPAEVVYLWSLDLLAGDPDPGGREAVGALHLVRALSAVSAASAASPPRLTFVTRGAQPNGEEKGSGPLAQSLLWGLARTLGHEHPELRWRAIDLDPAAWEGEIETLAAELEAGDDERQIAFRAGVRAALRLVPWKGRASAEPALRAEGTYLITGGLGALGLALAGWLVERGARHLLLLGRRPPGEAASARLAALEATGARALHLPVDVADRPVLAAALAQAKAAGMPPLSGVIHAAGVLDDGLLQDQDRQRFARVLAPKVAGAWNLHLLTREAPLDFFVLFSSFAALLGSAGQSSYAAANAFLDALAWHRRGLGLPALALDWGPWAEAGMAAEAAAADRGRWRQMGLELLPPEEGLLLLGEALAGAAPPQLAAAACDWARLATALPSARTLVAGWALAPRGTEVPAQSAAEPLREQLAGLPPRERRDFLVRQVRTRVARILHLEHAEALERQQPLMDLGLDSLMAIELRNALGSLVGRALPPTLIFKYPTIEALAAFLEGELAGAAPAVAAPASPGSDEAERAEQEVVAALTQDQTLALLAEELEQMELLTTDFQE